MALSLSPLPLTSPEAWEELLEPLRRGDRLRISEVLNFLDDDREETETLRYRFLDFLYPHRREECRVLGITGPPGVGKSTLTGALIRSYRERGKRVGILAVDPSSARSGGALLGDRIRMRVGHDEGVFVRSLASRGHLGGLSELCFLARVVLEVGFDRIIIETVGVGQNEYEILYASDCVLLVLQPESGDTIQFLKAGIIEIPDLIVLNKSDLPGSDQTLRELRTILGHSRRLYSQESFPRVLSASALTGKGREEIVEAVEGHFLREDLFRRRENLWRYWLEGKVVGEYGRKGLRLLGRERLEKIMCGATSPFSAYLELKEELNLLLSRAS